MSDKLLISEEKIIDAKKIFEASEDKGYSHKDRTLAIMLENQKQATHSARKENLAVLFEAAPVSNTTGVSGYDPVLIKMLKRALPNLVAYDVIGVQPMNMPTGVVFYEKARYTSMTGDIALKDEALTGFSGDKTVQSGDTPATLLAATPGAYTVGSAMATATAEALGDGTSNWNEMSFSIEKVTVTAASRALRADYSVEMAQDLKSVHGLEAQALLSDTLSNEILCEINREVFRKIYINAKKGMASTTTAGIWDVDADSQGRWFQEDAVSLVYNLGKDSNAINYDIRFGRGNFFIVSANLADVLAAAEKLETSKVSLGDIDGAGNTFLGTVGRFKVYMDPYINDAATSFACVGYKGQTDLEAGMFYCPYIPLEMYEAVSPVTFQPAIAFKTRYGLVANPFSGSTSATSGWFRKSEISGF